MELFRPGRDGGVSAWVSAGEAALLRSLVTPVIDMMGGDRKDQPQRSVVDELEALFNEGPAPQKPTDPVLARLLPDAYQDDPEKADEFRKYTESSLREAKKYFGQTLLDTLPENGGRVKLTGDQARDWMRAINDVRLAFGVRLEVTEEFEEQLAALDPEDPKVAAFEVYGWLGAVQESLVRALARLLPKLRVSRSSAALTEVISRSCSRSRATCTTRSSPTPARTTLTRRAA